MCSSCKSWQTAVPTCWCALPTARSYVLQCPPACSSPAAPSSAACKVHVRLTQAPNCEQRRMLRHCCALALKHAAGGQRLVAAEQSWKRPGRTAKGQLCQPRQRSCWVPPTGQASPARCTASHRCAQQPASRARTASSGSATTSGAMSQAGCCVNVCRTLCTSVARGPSQLVVDATVSDQQPCCRYRSSVARHPRGHCSAEGHQQG
jgi:hypothetical protein